MNKNNKWWDLVLTLCVRISPVTRAHSMFCQVSRTGLNNLADGSFGLVAPIRVFEVIYKGYEWTWPFFWMLHFVLAVIFLIYGSCYKYSTPSSLSSITMAGRKGTIYSWVSIFFILWSWNISWVPFKYLWSSEMLYVS